MKRYYRSDFMSLDKPNKYFLFSLVTNAYPLSGVYSKFCTIDIIVWDMCGQYLSTDSGIFHKILSYSVISRYGRFW